jgi:tetratricopeptide (TPR) repeat protein
MTGRIRGIAFTFLGILTAGLAGCQSWSATGGQIRPQPGSSHSPSREDASPLEPRDIKPETHLAAGRLHESEKQFAQALEQYQKAVELKPDFVEGHNRLGNLLVRLSRYEEARQAYNRAIDIAPEQAHLHNNLGFCHSLQRQWGRAEQNFSKALELNPAFARAHVNLAMALAQQERFDEAFNHFEQVLSLEDTYYNMGLLYQAKSQTVDAARSFQAALDVNPKLTAAKKRLDQLPPSAIREAKQQARTEASPAHRPTTQPAAASRPARSATTGPAS